MKFSSLTRIILLISILASLAYFAGYVFLLKSFKTSKLQDSESSRLTRIAILAFGRLEPEGENISVAGPVQERVARILVSEGDFVKAGQVLGYLESYDERLAQHDLAASQLLEIQEQIDANKSLLGVEIEQAQTQLAQVEIPQMLQIQSQQAVVRRTEAELAEAVREHDRFKYLYNQGAISQQQFATKQLVVNQARENFKGAQSTLFQLVKSRDTNIRNAKVNLRHAQASLEQVYARSTLKSSTQKLKLAKAELARTMIRSPRSGQILKIFAHPGEAISEKGILTMGNTRQMYAVAEVYETEVTLVKLGQRVTVSSPAFAQAIPGTVTHIGRVVFKNDIIGDDPAANSDARVVEVKIRLDRSRQVSGLSNLQVDVRIEL